MKSINRRQHPSGKISVTYEISGSILNAEIILPENTTGTFIWKGATNKQKGGINIVSDYGVCINYGEKALR
jgi:hypothetical protein